MSNIDMSKPVLYRYEDAVPLRNATEEELRASKREAERDGGIGVILVEGVRCYAQE